MHSSSISVFFCNIFGNFFKEYHDDTLSQLMILQLIAKHMKKKTMYDQHCVNMRFTKLLMYSVKFCSFVSFIFFIMGNIFDHKRLLNSNGKDPQLSSQFIVNNDVTIIFGGDNLLNQRVSKLIQGYAIQCCQRELPHSLHQLLLTFIGDKNNWNSYFITQLMSSQHYQNKARLDYKRHYDKDDYSFGLFKCHQDIATSCDVCFCSCCSVGEIMSYNGGDKGGGCLAGCIICGFVPCLYPCLITSKVRYKNGVDGNLLKDIARCYFCPCCEICVHLRQTRRYNWSGCTGPIHFSVCGLLCAACCPKNRKSLERIF